VLKRAFLGANISVVIATIMAAGMLAIVARIAAARGSSHLLLLILGRTWLLVLVLTIPYLIVRGLVWRDLLTAVDVRVPLRNFATSFAAGEMTKTLPGGLYVQNYLLARLEGFTESDVVRSSMSTTAILGLESAVALPLALIFQLPGEPWIFWALVGLVIAWIILLVLAWMLVHHWGADYRDRIPGWLNKLRGLLEDFLAAGGELLTPRTLVLLLPTALYMGFSITELYAITRVIDVPAITFADTAGIFALIVMVDVLVPIPTEIGLTEFTGLGALLAYNVQQSTAALVMLSFRLLVTGMNIALAAVVLLALRTESIGGVVDALGQRLSREPAL
jgi:uncharacterized membrane protein YbhN (UPF0104 family)